MIGWKKGIESGFCTRGTFVKIFVLFPDSMKGFRNELTGYLVAGYSPFTAPETASPIVSTSAAESTRLGRNTTQCGDVSPGTT